MAKGERSDAKYKAWNKAVIKRDCKRCRWPDCGKTKDLTTHHIKTFADHEELRYDVNNGITLCKECHDRITGEEEKWEKFLGDLIQETHQQEADLMRLRFGL